MQDIINFIMLICAAVASMGLGVFAAYAICRAAFAVMRWHSLGQAHTAKQPAATLARVS